MLISSKPLAPFTTWRVGGNAEYFWQPTSVDSIKNFLANLQPKEQPLTWLGMGSNVLIPDAGLPGTVICTRGLQSIGHQATANGAWVRAAAGVACAKLAQYCYQYGYGGLEFLSGIPGSVGGAVVMNAGAQANSTWEYLHELTTINQQGQVTTYAAKQFTPQYRQVNLPHKEWVVEAVWQLPTKDPNSILAAMQATLRWRKATQPIALPSCGSVFRNPPNNYAAKLIEAAGLKGLWKNDAQISPKHCNFIVNRGKAKAQDICYLIETIRERVYAKFAINLELECHIY